jgi:hypothetical protein
MPPPTRIHGCDVLAYAHDLADLPFTDALRLNVGVAWLGRVPRLAICEWDVRPTLTLYHCDEHWNCLGVQGWERPAPDRPRTVSDVIQRTERYYTGIANRWVLLAGAQGGTYAPSNDAELDRYWTEQRGDD